MDDEHDRREPEEPISEPPPEAPADTPDEPDGAVEAEHHPGRLAETRESFQPALWARLVAIGIVVVYGVLFIAFNTHTTKVSFVFVSVRVSLIFLVGLAVALGLVLGVLLSQLHRHRHRRS